jgi:hypothetical protein
MDTLSSSCQRPAIPKDVARRAHSHDSLDLWIYDGTLEDIHHALYVKRREM